MVSLPFALVTRSTLNLAKPPVSAVNCLLSTIFPATTTIFPDHPVPLSDDRVGVALSSDILL